MNGRVRSSHLRIEKKQNKNRCVDVVQIYSTEASLSAYFIQNKPIIWIKKDEGNTSNEQNG